MSADSVSISREDYILLWYSQQPGWGVGNFEIVAYDHAIDTTRWGYIDRLIIKHIPSGRLFADTVEFGATEMQDYSDLDNVTDEGVVLGREVEAREKVIVEYVAVADGS